MCDMFLEKSWAFASASEDIRFIRAQASVDKRLPLQECACLQPSQPESLPRAPMCDGAGRRSSADQTLPNPLSPLKDLSGALSSWLQSSGLRASIAAHIIQQKPDCLLSESQEHEALSIMIQGVGLGDAAPLLEVEPHQPLRLNLLQALMLKVPSSLQWPKKAQPHQDFMPLEMCEGNWSAAEVHSPVPHRQGSRIGLGPASRTAALSHSSRKAQPGEGAWQRPSPGPRQRGVPGQPQLQPSSSPAAAHSFSPLTLAACGWEPAWILKQPTVCRTAIRLCCLPLWRPLLSLLVAAPRSLAAHCTPAPCTTASQSLALRGRPVSSPPQEQR